MAIKGTLRFGNNGEVCNYLLSSRISISAPPCPGWSTPVCSTVVPRVTP